MNPVLAGMRRLSTVARNAKVDLFRSFGQALSFRLKAEATNHATTGGHMRIHIPAVVVVVITCSLAVSGQQSPPAAGAAPPGAPQGGGRGQQGPQVVSPEVNADR